MSEKVLLDPATKSQLLEMQKEVVRIQWAMQLIVSTLEKIEPPDDKDQGIQNVKPN